MSIIIAIVLAAVLIWAMPTLLQLARLKGRVYENTLTLIDAALIIYVLTLYVIFPLSHNGVGSLWPF